MSGNRAAGREASGYENRTMEDTVLGRKFALQHRPGFTLIEMLVVLGIIALLAAITFPVLAHVREKGRQSACASNLHQLGLAIEIYIQDNDERHPSAIAVPPYAGLPSFQDPTGWAGRVYPYVKSAPVFHCPTDPAAGVAETPPRVPVSYALNSNLVGTSQAILAAPSHTVLLFEVADDQAAITLPDEGGNRVPQNSAAGNGLNGALLNLTGNGSVRIDGAVYATGLMDNGGDGSLLPFNQYPEQVGRHSGGSNFLAADGHVTWRKGSEVSAGLSAFASTNAQAATGCGPGSRGGAPCAEGTAAGTHTLTFSVL